MRFSATVVSLCSALAGPAAASAQAAKLDLSPAAAARTVDADGPASSPSTATAADTREEGALAAQVDGLVRAGGETLSETRDRAATGVMWSAMRPWEGPHVLLHKVRYWYRGRGLDAAIANDGSVTFYDKDGAVIAPLPLVNRFGPGGGPSTPIRGTKLSPVVGVAEAVRMLRRHVAHEDPHALERADILERTRPLRDWLDARVRARHDSRAVQDVQRELTSLWFEGTRTPAQRQEQTFALWDGCADDALETRAAIVDFMHKLASARGACPFDTATLTQLNASRRSREAFVPCDPPPRSAP